MKKTGALLLVMVMMLCLCGAAFADSAQESNTDQMVRLVKNFFDAHAYPYEYDDGTFSTMFALNNAMEYAPVTVYVYDDMLSVCVDAPVVGSEEVFEKLAVFITLVNSEIYYAQFRAELAGGLVYLSCRSCNLVESVIPGESELYVLISEPLLYMEAYGDGISAVINGGDPYETFEACQAAVEAA